MTMVPMSVARTGAANRRLAHVTAGVCHRQEPAAAAIHAAAAHEGGAEPSAEAEAFRERGFVVLGGVLSPVDGADQGDLSAGTLGPACLRLCEHPGLVNLLAEVVGTDVQMISCGVQELPAAGVPVSRELSREGVELLNSHGPFCHPLLSESVRVFVALRDYQPDDAQLGLVERSHWNTAAEAQEDGCAADDVFRWAPKKGDVVVADLPTWRMARAGARSSEFFSFTCAKFAYQQHGALRHCVRELVSSGQNLEDRPLLRQMLGIEIAPELAQPKYGELFAIGQTPPRRWLNRSPALPAPVREPIFPACVGLCASRTGVLTEHIVFSIVSTDNARTNTRPSLGQE